MKEINALENYVTERLNQEGLLQADAEFIRNKLGTLREKINDLKLKVQAAEQKEKLGIERQKVFGKSQTGVEEARHANIIDRKSTRLNSSH